MHSPLLIGLVSAHTLFRDLLVTTLRERHHQPIEVDSSSVIHGDFTRVHAQISSCAVTVVCPWGLPRNGRHLVRHLASIDSRLRIVVVEPSTSADEVDLALAAGALAVIGPHADVNESLDVIESAARGDSHVCTTPVSAASPEPTAHHMSRVPSLSRRETEILQLVIDGLDIGRIAERLYISSKTVKHHLSAVYAKLGTTNRTGAVVRGLRLGVVELPST